MKQENSSYRSIAATTLMSICSGDELFDRGFSLFFNSSFLLALSVCTAWLPVA